MKEWTNEGWWVPYLHTHVSIDIFQDFSGNRGQVLIPGDEVGIQVGRDKLGLVVEHLLKMGDVPLFIGGVATESESNLIINSALSHHFQSPLNHFEGFLVLSGILNQELEIHWLGKLGLLTKSTWCIQINPTPFTVNFKFDPWEQNIG